MKTTHIASLTAVCSALLLFPGAVQANERHFAFTYETTTLPKGSFEFEEQFYWERGTGFDTFSLRQELEYGITDKFQLALYFANLEHVQSALDGKSTSWGGTGLEAIYQLTDPNKDGIGSALYLEGIMNDRDLELETKILLQKNFGPLIVSYNGVVEAHWEDHYAHRVGVLEQTAGLSYEVRPSFSIGLEAKHEVELDDWGQAGDHAVFVGPNASYRKGNFFAATTCLFRLSDVSGEPHIELGCVVGIHF